MVLGAWVSSALLCLKLQPPSHAPAGIHVLRNSGSTLHLSLKEQRTGADYTCARNLHTKEMQ